MISISDKKKIGKLIDAVMLLENPQEVEKFFRDLLTEKELIEFGNRWKAARMLEKKESYIDIAKETGLSSTTIARVSKWLNNGKDGYRIVLNKMNVEHRKSSLNRKDLRWN